MQFTKPQNTDSGKAYENTLLGRLLSLSCLPVTDLSPVEFFQNTSRMTTQDSNAQELAIQQVSTSGSFTCFEMF